MYYLRSKKRHQEIAVLQIPDLSFESNLDLKEEDIEPLLHYFAVKLPPKTREVFLLSRESNLTYKEISKKLSIAPKTVEAQMSRVFRIMKKVLKEQGYLVFLLLFKM